MILRRYGNALHSVEVAFDSKALNEIGFRRDRAHSIPDEEFRTGWEQVEVRTLEARADGDVHDAVEGAVLDDLTAQVKGLLAELSDGEVLVVENEQGVDYPKTRTSQKGVVVKGENRLHFTVRVEPSLRLGRYRKGR